MVPRADRFLFRLLKNHSEDQIAGTFFLNKEVGRIKPHMCWTGATSSLCERGASPPFVDFKSGLPVSSPGTRFVHNAHCSVGEQWHLQACTNDLLWTVRTQLQRRRHTVWHGGHAQPFILSACVCAGLAVGIYACNYMLIYAEKNYNLPLTLT